MSVILLAAIVVILLFTWPGWLKSKPTAEIGDTNTANTQIVESSEIIISNYLSGNLPDRKPMIIDSTKYTVPLQDGPYCVPHAPTGTEATHTFQVTMPEDWVLIIDSVSTVIDGKTYNSQLLILENPFTGDIQVTNGALCGGPIEWQRPLEQHRLEVLELFVKDPQVSYR